MRTSTHHGAVLRRGRGGATEGGAADAARAGRGEGLQANSHTHLVRRASRTSQICCGYYTVNRQLLAGVTHINQRRRGVSLFSRLISAARTHLIRRDHRRAGNESASEKGSDGRGRPDPTSARHHEKVRWILKEANILQAERWGHEARDCIDPRSAPALVLLIVEGRLDDCGQRGRAR